MKRKKWIWLILALLSLALLAWRMIPRPLSTVLGTEQEPKKLELHVMAETFEDGDNFFTHYKFATEDPDDALLEILEGKGYRPSFWNLLPVRPAQFSADPYIGITCIITVFFDGEPRFAQISMIDEKNFPVGEKIYHPAGKGTLKALGDYVMANGTIED